MTKMRMPKNHIRSDAARDLMRARALERGERRTQDVEERVRNVMRDVEDEMKKNGGIYPQNGGALSLAEVARRAKIHPTTFYTENQHDLGKEVTAWIAGLRAEKVVGRVRVRRTVSERLEAWKAKYEGLAQSHRDTELALQQVEAERDDALAEVERLLSENAKLRENLSKSGTGRVVAFPPKKS